jgi:hypothetical protein
LKVPKFLAIGSISNALPIEPMAPPARRKLPKSNKTLAIGEPTSPKASVILFTVSKIVVKISTVPLIMRESVIPVVNSTQAFERAFSLLSRLSSVFSNYSLLAPAASVA